MISTDATFSDLQVFFGKMYGRVDDRNYSTLDLLSFVLRHITQLLKAVRKQRFNTVNYHLCMGVSWTNAIANRMHINLATELWKRFPRRCPYCARCPCACKERAPERQKLEAPPLEEMPGALIQWQQMLSEIYLANTAQDSVIHLAEEIGELNEAIRNYLATHAEGTFEKIAEELTDVAANLLGLATCLEVNLSAGMAHYFEHGCPKCRANPCDCGYVTADDPI